MCFKKAILSGNKRIHIARGIQQNILSAELNYNGVTGIYIKYTTK